MSKSRFRREGDIEYVFDKKASIFTRRLKKPPIIDYGKLTPDDILRNQYIRLNTIYFIVDANGNKVPFRMNAEQYDFYRRMHNKNIILKARQRGFTTLIQLFLLDTALFTDNTSCGVIAHNKQDAQKFFDKKIKFAHENIPADFAREYVPTAEQDSATQYKFSNGSYISVGTSLRSDTMQYLHISEFGKMCAKYPDKADEVVSGALNTVAIDNWITIESTGEGAHGHFYDMTMKAKRSAEQDIDLSPMDYKFFFYPWWQAKGYRLAYDVDISEDNYKYFKELEEQADIILTQEQKNWYSKKQDEQQDRMWREYPSTPEEAFRGILAGAPFSRIMAELRRRGHITKVPHSRGYPVNTFWDLGRNDMMAIWFHQKIGFEDRFIDYYEDNFQGLDHYVRVLQMKPYTYGTHHLPHDAEVTELTRSDAKTRREVLEDLMPGDWDVITKTPSEEEKINMTRSQMGECYFDEDKCEQGINCLENAKYRWDEKLQAFQPNLQRTWAKHGADAFMEWGHGYRHRKPVHLKQKHSDTSLMRGRRQPAQGKGRRRTNQRPNASANDWRT